MQALVLTGTSILIRAHQARYLFRRTLEQVITRVPAQQVADRLQIAEKEQAVLDILTQGWSGIFHDQGFSLIESVLLDWIPRQRWFGAKTRIIRSVRLLDWVELPADFAVAQTISPSEDIAGAVRIPTALFYAEIAYAGGDSDRYQLPLAFSSGDEAEPITVNYPHSIIATFSTPNGVVVLHDASRREDFCQGLLEIIKQNASLNFSSGGRLDAHASSAFSGTQILQRLACRVGSAEQSNTSIIYGDKLILKLFRRLQPGENPDAEVGRFLTEVAHFPHIATFLGEIAIDTADREKTTSAILQGLVANQGDGWQWFLDQLAEFFPWAASQLAPPIVPQASFLTEYHSTAEHQGPIDASLRAAALLGRRTAEMHLALATPSDNPAFTPEPLTAKDLFNDARRIETQITSALDALEAKLPSLKDSVSDDVATLLSRRSDLLAQAHTITGLRATGQRIRIHGDYHLGQTLRTYSSEANLGDFVLLDFEGEPARPLAERRHKQAPLKDVAGMIRSFSYAAFSALDQYRANNPELAHTSDFNKLNAWASFWQNTASSAFLLAYRERIASNHALLPSPQESQSLLNAYLLEKALYELLYELNNRPNWLSVPLNGILAL